MSSRASISSLRRPTGWARQFFGATHREGAAQTRQEGREPTPERGGDSTPAGQEVSHAVP